MGALPMPEVKVSQAPKNARRFCVLLALVAFFVGCAEGSISPKDDADHADGSDTLIADLRDDCPAGSCPIGEQQCIGPAGYALCVNDGTGCGVFEPPTDCDAGEGCSEGSCRPVGSCVDPDNDSYGTGCAAGDDCDETKPTVNPGAAEVCDGIDNNCIGGVDEGCPDPCAGAPCVVGMRQCDPQERVQECVADANGCGTWGAAVACPTNTCSMGACVGCQDADSDGRGVNCPLGNDCDDTNSKRFEGNTESCDGIDNNCNTTIDEDFPTKGSSCTAGVGACQASGTLRCNSAGTDVACDAVATTGSAEHCGDSVDSDCNGNPDNGFESIGQSCTVGTGSCVASGSFVCDPSDNSRTLCNAAAPTGTPEVCDSLDNNCDGTPDNGSVCSSCTDDSLEDNDSSVTGTALTTARTYSGVMSCGADVDWYHLGTFAAGFSAPLSLTQPTGNNGVGAAWADLNAEFYCGSAYCSGMYGTTTSTNFTGACAGCVNGDRVTMRIYPAAGTQPASGTPYSLTRN